MPIKLNMSHIFMTYIKAKSTFVMAPIMFTMSFVYFCLLPCVSQH